MACKATAAFGKSANAAVNQAPVGGIFLPGFIPPRKGAVYEALVPWS